MIWEPQKLRHKGKACFTNMLEPIVLSLLTLICLLQPSLIMVFVFLPAQLCLMYTMTMNIKHRFTYSLYAMLALIVEILIIVALKIYFLGGIKETYSDGKEFRGAMRFYEALAYEIGYRRSAMRFNATGPFKCKVDTLQSFLAEGLMLIFLMIGCFFLNNNHRRIQKIRKVTKGECLRLIQLEIPKEEEEISIGTSKSEHAERKRQKQKQEALDNAALEELNKKIDKNYVGSRWFYKWNQYFYGSIFIF